MQNINVNELQEEYDFLNKMNIERQECESLR